MFRRPKKPRTRGTRSPRAVLIRQIVFGILLVLLFTALGTGIWYGSRVSALTIQNVEVIGGETIGHEALKQIAEEELTGAYYKLVPRRFAWMYPSERIASRISEIERVKHVHVERTSGKDITIIFEEYIPFALWCLPVQAGETMPSDCIFLDHEGYAFGSAPKLQGSAFVRFSETDRAPEIGVVAFPGEFVRTTEEFIMRAYDEIGLNLIQVEKTADDEVTYHIAGGGELKTTLRMSSDETIENLETILASQEFDHIEPGNFQYIDLRYGNKIFINEEPVISEIETATDTEATSSTESN